MAQYTLLISLRHFIAVYPSPYSCMVRLVLLPTLVLLIVVLSSYNVVVVVFTLTDRASTIPSNIRGCQSGTWSQRGTKVTRYSDQQGSKSRQKVIRLYKRWHRPIAKLFIQLPLLHIESSLDRLGLLSPTHDQRSQQQIGQTRFNQF